MKRRRAFVSLALWRCRSQRNERIHPSPSSTSICKFLRPIPLAGRREQAPGEIASPTLRKIAPAEKQTKCLSRCRLSEEDSAG
jgi:hypothetical protein